MLKTSKKIILICAGGLLIVLISVFLLYKPVILQEGNPSPLIRGVIRLIFSKDKIVKLDMGGDKYLTKSRGGREVLIALLNNRGYEFIDQLGSGYFFKDKNDNAALITHRYYSRFYSIWNLVMIEKSGEPIMADKPLIELNLPDSFKASYISFSNYASNVFKAEEYPKLESWPEKGEIECNKTPLESSLPLRISKTEINSRKYCVSASSEGAAGSVYTQYSYTTVIEGNVYLINFVARYPNCNNYPDREKSLCETERESFNLDILVDKEIEKMKLSGLDV